MLFSSPTFLFFFLPASLGLYFAAPTLKLKNLALLALSLVFYAWGEPRLLLVLAASIGLNFWAAIAIERREGPRRRLALGLAVAANLAILGAFKYAPLFVRPLSGLAVPVGLNFGAPSLLLPLGVAVFSLNALTYVVAVYRAEVPANRQLSEVALYIALFPPLMAGPIVQYAAIAARLGRRRHSLGRFSAGLRIFVIGLAQKLLIADQLAPLANALFDHAGKPKLAEAWIGTLAYSLQIYFDFAGYASMAIGLGIAFGFSLPRNFDLPYRARSVGEFWGRFNITLSGWLRDYVYRPLSGGRRSGPRTFGKLAVIFVLAGLWYGANWTFLLWGAWHGLFAIAERAGLKRWLERAGPAVGWLYATLAVMGGWVLFRAPNLETAAAVWRGMIGLNGAGSLGQTLPGVLGGPQIALLAIASLVAVLPFSSRRGRAPGLVRRGRSALTTRFKAATALATLADTGVLALLLFLAAMVVSGGSYSPLLSFRF